MNKEKVIDAVDRASGRATEHLSGIRDPSLPDYLDSQVQRFLETLQEMKASLEDPKGKEFSEKDMTYAISDGWPLDSELGKLICEAEYLFKSLKSTQ